MAFNASSLKLGRGFFNCKTPSPTPTLHNYSSSDAVTAISSAGYFPAYFGLDEANLVQAGDTLQVNSFNNDNNILNDFSFNYIIASVNPVSLILLDQLFYSRYNAVPFTGGATGTATFGFTREASGIVNLQILAFSSSAVSPPGGKINFTFSVPTYYQPDPTIYTNIAGFLGVTSAANGQFANYPPIVLNVIVSTTITIALMPNSNLPSNAAIVLSNATFQYYGKPV